MPGNATLRGGADRLDLPPTALARHPDTIVEPRELRAWLDELPALQPRETIRRLARQLGLLTRDPEPVRQLHRLVESFHAPVGALMREAMQALAIQPQARARPQREVLSELPGLLQELSWAHARVVALERLRDRPPPLESLYAALLAATHILRLDVLDARPLRPTLWRQICLLHETATRHGLDDHRCEHPLALPDDPDTIRALYLSRLVILLADPYRQTPACLRALFAHLPDAVGALRLARSPDGERHPVPVDPDGEHSPLVHARLHEDEPPPERYLLGLDTLVRALPERTEACPLRRRLAGDLARVVTRRATRRHPRHAHTGRFRCIRGLEAVHERLSRTQDRLAPADEDTPPGTPCSQNDLSTSGASFLFHPDRTAPLPGEWLLFEPDPADDAPLHRFVAQTRRRLVDDNGYQYIGVERLPGRIVPVRSAQGRPLLLQLDRSHGRSLLVAPAGHFTGEGTIETVEGGGKRCRLRHEAVLLRADDSEALRVTVLD